MTLPLLGKLALGKHPWYILPQSEVLELDSYACLRLNVMTLSSSDSAGETDLSLKRGRAAMP